MSVLARVFPALAGALAGLTFLPALQAGFVNWDDEAMLLKSVDWRGLGRAKLEWMFTTTFFGHWSPLAWLSWGGNYVLGGMDPWGYHLANLLLHAVNVALFWLISRRLLTAGAGASLQGRKQGEGDSAIALGALVAALLFGVHPLRVESVAWVSERRDVLCGLFYLLAVLAYLRGVANGGTIRGPWWALSLAAFAGALLSKAIAFTLPLSLLVLDAYPLRRLGLGWRALAREKLPYAALGTAAATVALVVRQESGNITDYEQYGPGARVALAGYSLWFYPWKLVWPAGLSPMYELPTRVDLSQWRFLGPVLGVLALTLLLVLLVRRWPGGLAAWAQSAIVLLPISGVIHSGNQLAHDRYSYLSGLGFAVLAGGAVTRAFQWRQRRPGRLWPPVLAGVASVVVLVGLAAAAWAQTRMWRDSETLWRAALRLDPSCYVCYSNLGRALADSGRLVEGEAYVRRAMALRPDRPGPVENMAVIMVARGRYGDAEAYFRRVVALRPDSGTARNSLGVALVSQGRNEEAEAEFQRARRLAPRLVDAHANLGLLYLRQGRHAEAIALLSQALAVDMGHAGSRASLARALRSRAVELVREGKLDEAGQLWTQASALAGDDPELLRALGQALVEQGRGADAIPALERAVTLNPKGAQERFWLARAYRLAGRALQAEREVAALRDLAPALAAELAR